MTAHNDHPTGTAEKVVSTGPWHEHLHSDLREALRRQAGPGWHLIADSDEFHTYPAPVPEITGAAESAGSGVVGGILLDRVPRRREPGGRIGCRVGGGPGPCLSAGWLSDPPAPARRPPQDRAGVLRHRP